MNSTHYLYLMVKMPEGPECRLTVDYLNKVMRKQTIVDWIFCGGGYTEEYPVGFSDFDGDLPLLVENVACKGKFIHFTVTDTTGNKYYILHSLMMTGCWQKSHDKYCKWFVELGNAKTIWFRDPRSLATLVFTRDRNRLDDKLFLLGPDIMTREFSLPRFKHLASKYSKRNITAFLMDQRVLSGCGNYIKAETLWYASVSPMRKVGNLNERELELIYEGLRIISRISYNRKGLSLKDYTNKNGRKGYYSNDLKVYGKKYAKRTRTADGRTTYWDPQRQV